MSLACFCDHVFDSQSHPIPYPPPPVLPHLYHSYLHRLTVSRWQVITNYWIRTLGRRCPLSASGLHVSSPELFCNWAHSCCSPLSFMQHFSLSHSLKRRNPGSTCTILWSMASGPRFSRVCLMGLVELTPDGCKGDRLVMLLCVSAKLWNAPAAWKRVAHGLTVHSET